jgi:hypothetical protein
VSSAIMSRSSIETRALTRDPSESVLRAGPTVRQAAYLDAIGLLWEKGGLSLTTRVAAMNEEQGIRLERRELMAGMALLLAACRGAQEEAVSTPMTLEAADLSVLRARVFFGHQSVGENILEGIRAIIAPRKLEWVDAKIGTNEQPLSKLEAFRSAMTEGVGKGAELAFMKFCYIDFNAATDVAALFSSYKKTMGDLQRECPKTMFVHFTAPLTTVASGPKAWVQKTLGRAAWGERENEKRHAYSEQLRAEYGGKDLVFDLAAIESGGLAHPQRFELEGRSLPVLARAFTDDGGHLNANGRLVVARELLRFLAKVPQRGA